MPRATAPPATPLQRARHEHGYTQLEVVRRLVALAAAGLVDVAEPRSLQRMLGKWENGAPVDARYQQLFCRLYDRSPAALGFKSRPGPTMPPPADLDYVNELHTTVGHLVALDTAHGGDDTLPLARRAFAGAHRRLATGDYQPGVESDLHAAVGELAMVAAWAAYDAGQPGVARQLTLEALFESRSAGDRSMVLFELAHLSMLAAQAGHGAEAGRVAREVLDERRLTPRCEAVFRVRLARSHALAGDRRAFDELDHARALTEAGATDRDPEWVWWVDAAELAWHTAMCRAALGDTHRAVGLFHEAYETRPPAARRARFNDLAHLLNAQVTVEAAGDADLTVTVLSGCVGDVQTTRTTLLLSGAAARATRVPALSEVAVRLHMLAGG